MLKKLDTLFNQYNFDKTHYSLSTKIINVLESHFNIVPFDIIYYPYSNIEGTWSESLQIYFANNHSEFPHTLRLSFHKDRIESLLCVNDDEYVSDCEYKIVDDEQIMSNTLDSLISTFTKHHYPLLVKYLENSIVNDVFYVAESVKLSIDSMFWAKMVTHLFKEKPIVEPNDNSINLYFVSKNTNVYVDNHLLCLINDNTNFNYNLNYSDFVTYNSTYDELDNLSKIINSF